MLDKSYYEKTDEIIAHYGRKAGSLIPIMQDIQAEYRYLPAELLSYVAQEIGITETKAYSVATFYENFSFEAKGKYVIKVCDGTACHVRGPVEGAGPEQEKAHHRRYDVHRGDRFLPGCLWRWISPLRPSSGTPINASSAATASGSAMRSRGWECWALPTDGTKVIRAETRTKGLYAADGDMAIKKSNENPLMDVFYNGYFKSKAHELLHNHE